MGWVKGEIDGNHDVQSTFKYDYSWLASLFLGSKVSEMVWVKGSIELRKHMMIFALGWEISCIHITRLSNSCHIFVKKTKSFILHHPSLFLSIPFNLFQPFPICRPYFSQPTNPTNIRASLPYPKTWTDPRLHQERWELHHPKPGRCRWTWRHDDDNILRNTKKQTHPQSHLRM